LKKLAIKAIIKTKPIIISQKIGFILSYLTSRIGVSERTRTKLSKHAMLFIKLALKDSSTG
jgi:hypothetical protein